MAASARIALLGQFQQAGFALASDGNGGTLVTYTPPPAHASLAATG